MAEIREPGSDSTEPEKTPEKANDRQLVDFFIKHIDNPCEVEVATGQIENIREFYIREAEGVIPKMKDPTQINRLKNKIEEYKK